MKKILLCLAAFAITAGAIGQQKLDANKKKPVSTKTASTVSTSTSGANPSTGATKAEFQAQQQQATQKTTQPATAATTQPTPDDVMKVNVQKHDFGKIKQGVPVTYSFELKNISDKPIVVENTFASCGCTTPEKIVEPIAPGATAKLKVQYNAASPGPFNKDVHIKLAGIAQDKVVQIVGEVVVPTPEKSGK